MRFAVLGSSHARPRASPPAAPVAQPARELAVGESGGTPWAMIAIALVGIALARVDVLTSDFGFDAGAWLYMSRVMGEGSLPYVDIWENKLPSVLWVGRAALATGVPHLALYVIDVAFTLAGVLGIAAFLRAIGAGRRIALFFGGLHVLLALPAWEGPHRIEVYSVGCMAAALAAIARAAKDGGELRRRWLFCAGACMAAAASFRQQEALSALVLGALVLLLGRARWLLPLASYALGGLAFAAALVLGAAAGGFLQGMIDVAVLGGMSYATGGDSVGLSLFGKTIYSLRGNLERMPAAWIAAAFGLVLALAAFRGAARKERLFAGAALALFATHLAVTFLSGHQWLHYHYPLGWSAALLLGAGWTLWRNRQGALQLELTPAPEWLLLSAFLVTIPFVDRVYGGLHRLAVGRAETPVDRMERLIRAHVPADEGVMILDSYDALGVLLRVPNPLGSYWTVLAAQCVFEDPASAADKADPWFLTSSRWGAQFIERIEREGAPWVVRDRGRRDRLTPVLERGFEKAAESTEFELWRRTAVR